MAPAWREIVYPKSLEWSGLGYICYIIPVLGCRLTVLHEVQLAFHHPNPSS